ncbi:DNA polymerase III subunit delta [Nocardioides acrostichi]|uniref:DNA-directed DNA polymerase n=1 Tax=Nocardioides acrostichi TaxID=2784339 RepID=A0A930Y7E2_9ACTN|nr:DNA polymerase III subunit delta [Nocardioides acrostichi]MBF4163325.1 DNA polymerase III subunit delta [Nocardioides acrostichi]
MAGARGGGSRGGPSASDVLGRTTLVTGKEEFFSERTVRAVRDAVRGYDAEAEISDAAASELTPGSLGELAAPSLFTATRCVVVRGLEDLPEGSVTGLLDYVAAPADDVALVLVHGGGQKGSGVLTKLRKIRAVTEVKSTEIKSHEYPAFAVSEARSVGARLDQQAASFLVEAVGRNLRALSAAVHQLASDFPDEQLTEERVGQYFGGRAEASSFAVADASFSGRRLAALEELRWALDGGASAPGITAAFAAGARSVARFKAATARGGGRSDNDLARDVGVPPWKVRSVRDQARGWSQDGLVAAIRAVAQADADVKGAASDAAYTLERLVLTITELREAARR